MKKQSTMSSLEPGKNYYEGSELSAVAEAGNYYLWIMQEFGSGLGTRILEVGAGVGTVSELLLSNSSRELTCLEPASNLIPTLRQRLERARNGGGPAKVEEITFEEYEKSAPAASFDTVVCINVLEHIEDDLRALREMHRLLQKGGQLCLFVPALPIVYGELDRAFGHHRRYTKRRLRSLAVEAGFSVVKLRYFNLPGSLAWMVMGKVFGKSSLKEAPVKWYDNSVIPFTRFAESICPPPFGQSLLLVAAA